MDPSLPRISDRLAGTSPSGGRGVPHLSQARFIPPKSLGPRQRSRTMRGANPGSEGRLNKQRSIGLRHFLRCRIRLRIRRFLRPTLRRPLPRRRLAMRSPLGIGERPRHESETNRMNSDRAKTPILNGTSRLPQGLHREDSFVISTPPSNRSQRGAPVRASRPVCPSGHIPGLRRPDKAVRPGPAPAG